MTLAATKMPSASNPTPPRAGQPGESRSGAGGALKLDLLKAIADQFWTDRIWMKTPVGPRHFRIPLKPDKHLGEHISGDGPPIGLAPIVPGTAETRVSVLDFDDHAKTLGWDRMVAAARPVVDALRALDYEPMVFRSRNGRGVHVYLFWQDAQDARSVREMLRKVMGAYDLVEGTAGAERGEVEIYPRQDRVPAAGAGNMVILAFAGESVLLDSTTFKPVEPSARTIPFSPPVPIALTEPEGTRSAVRCETYGFDKVQAALSYIPNPDLDYDSWFRVICAVHSATDGDGLEVAREWSAKSGKHSDEFLENEVWCYLRDREDGITARTLFSLAEANGWTQSCEDDFEVMPEPPKPRFKETYARTELANAERLLNCYGDRLMFVPELEAWYWYGGMVWRQVPIAYVESLALRVVRSLPSLATRIADDNKRAEFLKFAASSQKHAMVRNMTVLASRECQVPATKLDQSEGLLCVENGVVDLQSGELRPHDPKRYMTLTTSVHYNPAATAPLWERTLAEIFRDDRDLIGFLQRLIGYAAMGAPAEHVLPIPHGSGANGKGTVFGTVQHILGGYATSCRAETFISSSGASNASGPREDILRLRGKRFVYVNEPEEGGELREGTVKSLASTDVLAARGMYAKHTVEIKPSWVAFMPTNHKPIVKGDDLGIWRRLMLIPFERSFQADPTVQKDPARGEKLLAEAEGILRWIVEGALAYQRQGLAPPASVTAAAKEYREEMDLLADWLAERCEIGPYTESVGALWLSWKAWAELRGTFRFISSDRAFGRKLKPKGFESFRSNGARYYHGLRVRPAVETLNPEDLA